MLACHRAINHSSKHRENVWHAAKMALYTFAGFGDADMAGAPWFCPKCTKTHSRLQLFDYCRSGQNRIVSMHTSLRWIEVKKSSRFCSTTFSFIENIRNVGKLSLI